MQQRTRHAQEIHTVYEYFSFKPKPHHISYQAAQTMVRTLPGTTYCTAYGDSEVVWHLPIKAAYLTVNAVVVIVDHEEIWWEKDVCGQEPPHK